MMPDYDELIRFRDALSHDLGVFAMNHPDLVRRDELAERRDVAAIMAAFDDLRAGKPRPPCPPRPRPLIVVDRPSLINKAAISPEKVRRLRAAADVAADPREVADLVLAALRQPERLSPERRRTAADLFFKPGTATDRALALVYRLIDLPMPDRSVAAADSGRQFATVG